MPGFSGDLHHSAVVYALMLLMHGTGLTQEADCALCGPGKYQTGVGLMAAANCAWCEAGKYQSGSGLNTVFWLSLFPRCVTDSDDNINHF
jgi:hypothetical protein